MVPNTQLCHARLQTLNNGYKGIVVALREGSFYLVPIRYEIVEFRRWTDGISDFKYCTVVLRCLTAAEPAYGFVLSAVEDEVRDHTFSLDNIEELLVSGTLTVISNIHSEDWYRPDQACLAV